MSFIEFLKNIRSLLERNKIFLDIVLTIFIIYLAYSANEIAKQQKIILYQEKQPVFFLNVVKYPSKSANGKIFFNREIQIYNLSGEYENFSTSTISILKLDYQNKNNTFEKYFYINGFYTANLGQGRKKGLIRRIVGYSNESKLIEIEGFINQIKDSLKLGYFLFDFQTFTKISYLDILGNRQNRYYNTSYGDGFLISNELGEKLFFDYNNAVNNGQIIDFDKLEKKMLINIVK